MRARIGDAKTIKYDFHYLEKWSYGGLNGEEGNRYVTDYFKAFLCLYEDGTVKGCFLNNVGMAEYQKNMYDPDNRVQLMYYGYWIEENGKVTMNTMAKDEINNPEYVTTEVTLNGTEEVRFDFPPRRTTNTEPAADASDEEKAYYGSMYGLVYDGTVHYNTFTEEIDAINEAWDAAIEE